MQPIIEKLPRFNNRAMASFVVDDFSATTADDTRAYATFAQWVQSAGLKGEISIILGMRQTAEGTSLLDPGFPVEFRHARSHIDNYMEVMTHSFLYDFAANRIRTDGPHEGVWLIDRSCPMEEYLDYFRNIARRALDQNIRHSGLTLPGCGCPPCSDFYRSNHLSAHAHEFNAAAYEALLTLVSEGLLSAPVCGLFVGSTRLGPADAIVMSERDRFAVYDLPPGIAGDFLGRWDRNPIFLSADAYITPDGQSGRLPQLLAQNTRTLILYGHWQSLNPNGIGYPLFQEVARRLDDHHADKITWMRPTEIAAYRHTERHTEVRPAPSTDDGQSFTLAIPFAPLHPLTFRILSNKPLTLRTPAGNILSPTETAPAGSLFNLLPENGRYDIL